MQPCAPCWSELKPDRLPSHSGQRLHRTEANPRSTVSCSDWTDVRGEGFALNQVGIHNLEIVEGSVCERRAAVDVSQGPDARHARLRPVVYLDEAPLILHAFAGGADGSFLQFGVIADSSGNLFGTPTRAAARASRLIRAGISVLRV